MVAIHLKSDRFSLCFFFFFLVCGNPHTRSSLQKLQLCNLSNVLFFWGGIYFFKCSPIIRRYHDLGYLKEVLDKFKSFGSQWNHRSIYSMWNLGEIRWGWWTRCSERCGTGEDSVETVGWSIESAGVKWRLCVRCVKDLLEFQKKWWEKGRTVWFFKPQHVFSFMFSSAGWNPSFSCENAFYESPGELIFTLLAVKCNEIVHYESVFLHLGF